jgi:hypothetical protein
LSASAKVEVDCARLIAHGSGAQAHATAHVSSPIDPAAVDPSADRDAAAVDAAICQGIGRNARDAEGGGYGKSDDGPIRHGVSFRDSSNNPRFPERILTPGPEERYCP